MTEPAPPPAAPARGLLALVLAALALRVLYAALLPGDAMSVDLAIGWPTVVRVLDAGGNPYARTGLLNWPPLWMGVLFTLGRFAKLTGVPVVALIRLFLVAVEAGLLAATWRLGGRLVPARILWPTLLVALALDPIAVLLVIQHGNFDVLPALFIVLALGSLLAFAAGAADVDWLLGCAFLGLATLAKTFPVVLFPLLAHRAVPLPRRTRLLGAALALGPVALGLGVLYVLAPAAVTDHVLRYRSAPGFFGMTGLLGLAGLPAAYGAYGAVFALALLAGLLAGTRSLLRHARTPRELVLAAGLVLLAIPALGPGYAPQYAFWHLPLLALSFAAWPELRRVLGAAFVVAVATYVVEYGLFPTHGAALVALDPTPALMALAKHTLAPGDQTLIRLPLFAAHLAVLVAGARALGRRATPSSAVAA